MLNKVLNELRRQNIGYYVSENEVYLKGNEEVYELYKKLSIINFEKYQKKNELCFILENVLDNHIDEYEKIKDYLFSFN